jgi:hypothetical protein
VKLICKVNNLNNISDGKTLSRLQRYISSPDGDVDLEIGKIYTVYGIVFWDNCPWYYICSTDHDEYPTPYASDFFSIKDGRLSSHWRLSSNSNGERESTTILAIEPWAQDDSFYENLLDGDSNAEILFAKYRKILDQE